jgi:hypothetical protein
MLIEQGKNAYISEKIEDGRVVLATRYICLNGKYTRVGESVEIEGEYKEVHLHNILARHSFKEMPVEESVVDLGKTENPDGKVVEDDDKKVLNVTDVETTENNKKVEVVEGDVDGTVTETVTEVKKPSYTFIELKQLSKPEQNAIAKELGLKGYHNLKEDDRIEMILSAIK